VLSEGRAVLLKSYGDPMFANSISLYEPINQYKPIADCIGFVDGPLVHMSYPGLSFIKIPFPTRMTVIQLSNGDSWLHSPIAYQAELANAIEAMGPIGTSCHQIRFIMLMSRNGKLPSQTRSRGLRRASASAHGHRGSPSTSTGTSHKQRRNSGKSICCRRWSQAAI
jgi:hypothetical protein